MESWYCVIKDSDITQAHVNYSNSRAKEQMPKRTSTIYLLYLFPISTVYRIVEFPKSAPECTDVFDSYEWYTKEEIIKIMESDV